MVTEHLRRSRVAFLTVLVLRALSTTVDMGRVKHANDDFQRCKEARCEIVTGTRRVREGDGEQAIMASWKSWTSFCIILACGAWMVLHDVVEYIPIFSLIGEGWLLQLPDPMGIIPSELAVSMGEYNMPITPTEVGG